jgi:hypothetical protein
MKIGIVPHLGSSFTLPAAAGSDLGFELDLSIGHLGRSTLHLDQFGAFR